MNRSFRRVVSYLLDTNTVSELMKPVPEPAVLAWIEEHEQECFMSAITVGEIEKGIALLPAGRKKNHLQEFFQVFAKASEERVLSFDTAVARRWAVLNQRVPAKGPDAFRHGQHDRSDRLALEFVVGDAKRFGFCGSAYPESLETSRETELILPQVCATGLE